MLIFYALCASVALVWFEPSWLSVAAASLCALFAWQDYRSWSNDVEVVLGLDPKRRRILVERSGQPYFFAKYKVYPTRWFAILKLVDSQQNRTLFLKPDRFASARSYRDCRFTLRRMETDRAA